MKTNESGDPIDVHVGDRVRQRRALIGMSQTALGKAVGLTFQQVQKYEKGSNRISASRLYEFAAILNVPVDHFFEGLEPARKSRRKPRKATASATTEATIDTSPETLKLVRAYYKIRDAQKRNAIRAMIASLS